MTTDTSETGLERLICTAMTGHAHAIRSPAGAVRERPSSYGAGWALWRARTTMTASSAWTSPSLPPSSRRPNPRRPRRCPSTRTAPRGAGSLARLQGQIAQRGTIAVLRQGIRHGPYALDLFYGTPSPGNERARDRYAQNRFSVTRQLRYSHDNAQLALDLCLFINGLPVATFELKNSLTKQTVEDAIEQYKRDRNPRERLFEFGRCLVHFAVDDHEVRFCTHLQGKTSWFLPFNRGWDDGAGNPPNPNGLKTDYLWKRVLTRDRTDRHHRELRAGRRESGRQDAPQAADADLAALPPARSGPPAAGRCVRYRGRPALLDSTLGR